MLPVGLFSGKIFSVNRLILFSFLLSSFYSHAQTTLSKKDLGELKKRMSGSFSSEAQAKSDTDYFHIVLHMAPIWPQRKDGFWLYVEQAVATAADRPYRQRVYHVTQQNDSLITSEVFELNSPLRFAGVWKQKNPLAALTPDSLTARSGCAIYLSKSREGHFKGSTKNADCPSNLRGAAYATSEVVITKDRMLSWDRGWNKEGQQVWGAEKGGYEFIRLR